MHRLIRTKGPRAVTTRRLSAERGAVATIVAILLGGGVLMGFGALTIDVGNLLWERRQLQNGADAAVLDLARICGTTTTASTACVTGNTVTDAALEELVDENANDNASDLVEICADGLPQDELAAMGVSLGECRSPSAAELSNCPPPTKYGSGFPYVQAHTKTETQSGGTLLPYILAQTITGTTGASVGACARATWGAPSGVTLKAPLTISECEWDQASSGGTNYAEAPVYNGTNPLGYGGAGQPLLPLSKEVRLYTQYTMDPGNACENWNGHDAPGAFSYLEGSGCSAPVQPPLWVKGQSGNNWPAACGTPAPYLGKVINIPVHFCMVKVPGSASPSGVPPSSSPPCSEGTGQTWYYLRGWAKFYLSGYKVSGTGYRIDGGAETCNGSGSSRCLAGWFTSGVISADSVTAPSSTNFGAIGVVPAG